LERDVFVHPSSEAKFKYMSYKEYGMRKFFLLALVFSTIGFLSASTTFSGRSSSIRVGEGITFDLNTHLTVDEGTFRIDSGGTLSGDLDRTMNFSQGILEYHDYETFITGTVDIDQATHDIILGSNGDILRSEPGTILDGIALSGGVSATILGQPFLDDTILLNPGSQLHIGIQSRLNKNIESSASGVANWVGIVLEDDLKLEDDIILDIVGTVSFNSKSLITGGKSLTWSTKDQTWYNAADLTLGGDLTLGATIIFDGSSTTTSYIIGNGHSLDMNDKCLYVMADHTLRIENLTIKNLKNYASGGINGAGDTVSSAGAISIQSGATVEFKDVTILMDATDTYVFDSGTIEIVEGGFLKILPGSTTQDFYYTQSATSFNIKSNASLLLGRDSRFVFGHSTDSNMIFEDDTSELSLENSEFQTDLSWSFSTGTLVVDGKSTLDTNSKIDYISSTATIVIMPGATLEVNGGGTLEYNEA
jgi:hypothetical protein